MKVLLTSDSKFGSALVRHALERLGHQVQDTGTAGAGTYLANQLWQADVVVAAMVAARSSRQRFGAVSVEIGIALERGLPILLVSKSGLSHSFLAGLPRVDYANDEDLLATQLELLLQAIAEGSPREGFSRGTAAPAKALHSTSSNTAARAQALEQQVGALLQAKGAEMLDQPEYARGTGRPDFTVFFPGSSLELGVVLVEVKAIPSRVASQGEVRRIVTEAARLLSQRVLASRSGLGLLVYEGDAVVVPPTPMTVSMSMDQLQQRLASWSLDQVLRRARNEAIHSL